MNSNEAKLNKRIRANKVLLIDETGEAHGEMFFNEALALAESKNMDLWQVSAKEIPTCRIVDYGKMMYDKAKKNRQNKKLHKSHDTKEMSFNFHIGDHDLEVKNNKVSKFLMKGMKVLYSMDLVGRECKMVQEGQKKFNTILIAFEGLGTWEDCKFGPVHTKKRKAVRTISAVLKPKIN